MAKSKPLKKAWTLLNLFNFRWLLFLPFIYILSYIVIFVYIVHIFVPFYLIWWFLRSTIRVPVALIQASPRQVLPPQQRQVLVLRGRPGGCAAWAGGPVPVPVREDRGGRRKMEGSWRDPGWYPWWILSGWWFQTWLWFSVSYMG